MKRKSLLVITVLTATLLMSMTFISQKAEKKVLYKNLKVLPKNTTKEQMDSIMKNFSASLGVRCTNCHVRGNDAQKNFDFASDENKNKITARQMLRMTNKINRKFFRDEEKEKNMPIMTCYSCHHGQEKPATKPPASQNQGPRPGTQPGAPATTQPGAPSTTQPAAPATSTPPTTPGT